MLLALVLYELPSPWQPVEKNDSYQYLSVASNFQQGLLGYTSLITYDEERLHGTAPAPSTTFPIGFPAAIAALGILIGSNELAALLLSLVLGLGCVVVMDFLGRELALGTHYRTLALAAFSLNEFTVRFSGSAITESTFTFLSLLAQLAFLRAIRIDSDKGTQVRLGLCSGLLLGICYWIRYAGLFFTVSLVPIGLVALALRETRLLRVTLVAAFASFPLILLGMLRNVVLIDSWRGGNTKVVFKGIGDIANDTLVSIKIIATGSTALSDFFAAKILLALFVICLVAFGPIALIRKWRRVKPASAGHRDAFWLLSLFSGVYFLCVEYADATTPISHDARYFFPILPTVLLVLASLGAGLESMLPNRRRLWMMVLLCSTRGLWRPSTICASPTQS